MAGGASNQARSMCHWPPNTGPVSSARRSTRTMSSNPSSGTWDRVATERAEATRHADAGRPESATALARRGPDARRARTARRRPPHRTRRGERSTPTSSAPNPPAMGRMSSSGRLPPRLFAGAVNSAPPRFRRRTGGAVRCRAGSERRSPSLMRPIPMSRATIRPELPSSPSLADGSDTTFLLRDGEVAHGAPRPGSRRGSRRRRARP